MKQRIPGLMKDPVGVASTVREMWRVADQHRHEYDDVRQRLAADRNCPLSERDRLFLLAAASLVCSECIVRSSEGN